MFRTTFRAVVFLLLGLLTRLVLAQAGSADLTGEVSDNSGGLITGAKVTATNAATIVSTTTVATSAGLYLFTNLSPGLYTVSGEATGFQKLVRTGITLITGERTRLDLKLALGDVKESVTVSGDAPLLQTETASITQWIDHEKVLQLPLNGRTFVQLATLAPGVMLPPGTLLPRINGGRPRTNEYLFDGISALQPEPGQVVFFPIIDSIQEFNIQTNTVPAEFGRFNGGVVNLSTRSGSNAFRGSLWDFFRNEVLNARNYFAPVNQAKPEFRRNQYGAVLGGRLSKIAPSFSWIIRASNKRSARFAPPAYLQFSNAQGISRNSMARPMRLCSTLQPQSKLPQVSRVHHSRQSISSLRTELIRRRWQC